MKIINREELCKCPNGALFSLYDEQDNEIDSEIHILVDNTIDDEMSFEEMLLTPVSVRDHQNHTMGKWKTGVGFMDYYDVDQMFVVYEPYEIQGMIDRLLWASKGCRESLNKGHFTVGQ